MARVAGATVLEFRLLGPLEVRAGGRPVAVGGARQRELLALLLLHRLEVVPTDLLLEELFANQRAGGRNALQVAIMRLRRALGDGDVIATEAGGYALHVESDQIDSVRFECLLAAARKARAAGDDAAAATRLRDGLALWHGRALSGLGAHDFIERERRRLEELRLEATMDRIDADLALGKGADLIAELETLVAAHPLQERLRGQLMLALYRAGRQADALGAFQATRRMLDHELGLEPSRALQRLQRAILIHDGALDSDSMSPRRPSADVCPFKGLAAFEATDAGYFFGRERVVAGLVARLAEDNFVALVGPSGSGKSSTLRAGLLPALAEGALPGSTRWRRVLVRPGSRPLDALERKLDGSVAHALAGLAEHQRLLIVVDQFEEIFVACADERRRDAFVEALTEAAGDPERRAVVVLGVRADFYGRCAAYPELAELLSGRSVLLRPMTRHELKRTIYEPAGRSGLEVEPELAEALARDVARTASGLPLLSSTLLELWRRRDRSRLTLAAYQQTGGVEASVARLAEAAYAMLDERERATARKILLRLAGEEDGALVGRRLPLGDFDADTDAIARRVLVVLTERRLLTMSQGSVELAHEALLRHWPRLEGWVEDDVHGRRVHSHLMRAAREWNEAERDPTDLYRGARLAATLEWAAAHPHAINALEGDFLAAARDAQDHEATFQRRQNRRLRAALAGAIALLALAVLAGAVALAQRHSARQSARVSLARGLGAEALIEPRVDRALLLAREAVALDDSPDTAGALLGTLLRSPAAIGTFSLPLGRRPLRVSVSPDGRALAVVDNSSALRLYDARTHHARSTPRQPAFSDMSPSFLPNGSLAVAGQDAKGPRLELLDARTLQLRRGLRYSHRLWVTPSGDMYPFASGDRIFVAWEERRPDGGDGRAWLDSWDPRTQRWTSTPLGSDGITGAGPAAGGRVVTVTNTEAATWDAATARRLSRVPVTARGRFVSVAPVGHRIVLTDSAGAVRIVDVRTGATRRLPGGHNGNSSAVFSPDGRVLASPGDDGTIILWDARTAQLLETLVGHGGRVIAAAFSPDGRTLYSCSLDGAVFAWDLAGTRRFGRPFDAATTRFPQTVAAPPLAVAPDGKAFITRTTPSTLGVFTIGTLNRRAQVAPLGPNAAIRAVAWGPHDELVAGDARGRVALWHGSRPSAEIRVLGTLKSAAVALAISPSGDAIAAVEGNPDTRHPQGSLTIWRATTGRRTRALLRFPAIVTAIAYSPDGTHLSVALGDGRVLVLDTRTGRVAHTLQASDRSITSLAYAPDGTLATGSFWGIVQRWNPATSTRLGHQLLAAAAPLASIAFSPDGATMSTTGGSDGVVKLWTTRDEQQLGANLPGSTGQWGSATFTPDGQHLIAVYDDGRGTIWPTTLRAWEQHACAVAARTLSRDEWTRYVPDRRFTRVC
jgi:WD40 repeat protein/DNA-binding SARP family transcriptional activator/energy-coupling factor transporter ATP-binding protein EcfA2